MKRGRSDEGWELHLSVGVRTRLRVNYTLTLSCRSKVAVVDSFLRPMTSLAHEYEVSSTRDDFPPSQWALSPIRQQSVTSDV